ncbi:MAG: cyclic nucleotide-binding domain-containing protein [Polyangiaceae bacterium]|jgi:CRP-like cAMP-binding protein|nr:cyclic nucleotide-binding domain-containing protein [Polyangiaceae bacterium]
MLGEFASDAVRNRVLVMRTLPHLAALDEDDLSLLAEEARLSLARRGAVLFHEGEALDRVYFLAEGSVRVRRGAASSTVTAPAELGLTSLFAGLEQAKEAVAVTDATLIELPASVVLASFYESPSIARNTIRMAARALLARRGNLPVAPGEAPAEVAPGEYLDRTPTLVEKMLVMRRSPVWAHASLDAVAELCRHLEELRVPAGELLWDIGAPSDQSYRLEHGIVRCENAKGEVARVGGGHLIGGLDALAGLPRAYRALTEVPCIFFRIRASTQLAILEVHPQMAARLRLELARALVEEQEREAAAGR